MQDKNSKIISQLNRNEADHGFVLFRSDTIQLWSWLEGNQQLDEPSLKSLSEDISYRIRETLDNAVSLMHQCKRSRLKTSDINQAFKILNIEKTYGYGTTEPLSYQIIKTDDLNDKVLNQFKSKFFELNDPIVELKLREKKLPEEKEHILHGNWFVVNGSSADYRNNENNSNVTIDFDLSENEDTEGNFFFPQINHDYYEYYEKVISIIMGEHDCKNEDQELFNMVMDDLKTNSKLQPIVPNLISFFHQAVQVLMMKITDVKKEILIMEYLDRILMSLKSLILNKNVFLAPKGYFTRILSTLLYSCIQNSYLGFNLSLELRQKSAFVLVMFLKLYERFSIETIKYILATFIKPALNESVYETKQFASLIGIASLFFNFGGQIIDEFYQEINTKIIEMDEHTAKPECFAVIINQLFLGCLTRHFKWIVRKNLSESKNINYSYRVIFNRYKTLVDLYGDSFVNQILNLHESFRYRYFFESKLKKNSIICEKFQIKLRSLENYGQSENKTMEEVFENYAMIQKKYLNIKFGKIVRIKTSKLSVKNDNVLLEKKIYLVKYKPIFKKNQEEYQQNLSFFYRDTFL